MSMSECCCEEYKNKNAYGAVWHIVGDPQMLAITVWMKKRKFMLTGLFPHAQHGT